MHRAGGAALINNLLGDGALDELILLMCPRGAGAGQPLFGGGSSCGWDLTNTIRLPLGALRLIYRPARPTA